MIKQLRDKTHWTITLVGFVVALAGLIIGPIYVSAQQYALTMFIVGVCILLFVNLYQLVVDIVTVFNRNK